MSRKDWREFDWPLLLCALAAAGFGVAMIFSTIGGFSAGVSPLKNIAVRQALYVGIGLLGFFVLVNIDYKLIIKFSPFIYGIIILLLLAVEVLPQSGPIYSPVSLGARRWITFTFIEVQPSEFAKIAVTLMLAKYMSDSAKDSKKLRFLLISLALALVPFIIVFKEPDLGSSLTILAIWLVMVIAAHPRWLYLGLGLALAIPGMVLAWTSGLIQDYQKARLLAFLDPASYLRGEGRNLIVARSAIGSGGLFGQGYMHGAQSQGGYLSINHADYIFSVVGEEFGFAGCIALIVLLYIIISRCFSVASKSKDQYGQLLGVGIGGMLLVQTFVNVGMNIGILPVTGIPLPFVSAGGSSVIAILFGLGILESVAIYRKSGVYDYTDYEYDRIVSPNYRPSGREQRAAARGR